MALYDQETVRNNGQTCCSRWKASVNFHVDQMMRTRNLPRVKKGKKACVERKVRECFQWKAHGQCSKGDSCSFSHDEQVKKEICTVVRDEKYDHRRPRLTKGEKNPQKHRATEMKTLQSKTPSCKFGHPPVCQNYKSETGCKYGRTCFFRHVEADEKPSKKSKKGGAKGSGCVSRDACPRNLFEGKRRNWDQSAPSNSTRARGTT